MFDRPFIPEFENSKKFAGRSLHSSGLVDPSVVKNQRVLIIGIKKYNKNNISPLLFSLFSSLLFSSLLSSPLSSFSPVPSRLLSRIPSPFSPLSYFLPVSCLARVTCVLKEITESRLCFVAQVVRYSNICVAVGYLSLFYNRSIEKKKKIR